MPPKNRPPRIPLENVRQDDPPKKAGDTHAAQEIGSFRSEAELKSLRYEQRTKHFEDEHLARIRAIRSMALLVKCWLAFVAVILIAQGFFADNPHVPFKLTDNVLLAVLGITTVNVLGLVLVGARYLFAKEPRWMEDPYGGDNVKRT